MSVVAEPAAPPDVAPSPAPPRTLRIALLNPCFWPEVRRGAERLASELAAGLIGRGHSVRLITGHPGRPRHSVEDGLEVLRLWRPPESRLRRRLYEDYLTHVPFSYIALRAGHDDIANALSPPDATAAGRWAARGTGVSVFSHMGIPTRRFLVGRRRRLELTVAACRQADAVVALSRAGADAFREVLGVRARVIHPGVDVRRFTPGGERAEQPTIFCNASADVPYKRVELLVRALPLVRACHPRARLLLPHPRKAELAAALLECDGVELIAPGEGEDNTVLLDAYRRAWVSALPSIGEAFGLALSEALACGTPGVGTAAGGIPEVIDRPQIGRVFDGDEHSLARALLEALELAQDPSTADACRARAVELSSEKTVEAYESLYLELHAR